MKALVFDTETTSLKPNMLIYDMGWCIGDLNSGEILHKESYLVKSVFDTKAYEGAWFYADNDSTYRELLKNNEIEILPLKEIRQRFNNCVMEHRPEVIGAFNIDFDVRALNASYKQLLEGTSLMDLDNLKNKGFIIMDIPLVFSHSLANKAYVEWAIRTGRRTPAGHIKTTVEAILNYILMDEYKESHTAGQDAIDEFKILYESYLNVTSELYLTEKRKPWKIIKDQYYHLYKDK